MTALDDEARFQPYDASAVVAASFMCPGCLRRPSQVFLIDGETSATCRCGKCDLTWIVAMSVGQCGRMRLSPPREILVLKLPDTATMASIFSH
jgi:hypothetical protein